MAGQISELIERLFHRRVLRRWGRVLARVQSEDWASLRRSRTRAREIRRRVDMVLHVADSRLTLPLIGPNVIEKPVHADWAYRPQLWRGPISPPGVAAIKSRTLIGDEVRLFHDCKQSELTVRQIRNSREEDLAPFGLRMDVFEFDGSFLSLVIDMPNDALQGLQRRHLIQMKLVVEMEQSLELFARLNIKHGPNSEQVVRELQVIDGMIEVDFDLAYTNLNEKRLERAWVDLIFENPRMNQMVLRDVTFTRRPRSEL